MKSFKQHCIELRKKDKTLNEIMEITGRSKTSVYFHVRDIKLSEKKRKEISRNSKQRAIQVAANRKGKALRPFEPFSRWTPKRILLVSHLIFDGEIARERCVYNNRSRTLIDRVEKLMKDVYDFPPRVRVHPVSRVTRIEFSNVELKKFLYEKHLELLRTIPDLDKKYQREFLRAFFDDEGCMDYRIKGNKRCVRGYQKDQKVLVLVQELLQNLDIEASLRGKNEIVISGKENLRKFKKEINFSEGVRLNPRRTNSFWKKNIEKRTLLDMAIKSYRT